MTPKGRPRAVCRDCGALDLAANGRCLRCGSPRVLRHDHLARLTIAHVDCDAFYASVAKRDDPTLRDRPVIIGGSRRGVVLTACYVARIAGVRSAMPMFEALRLCPHATVVRPDFPSYVEASRAIRTRMLALTPLVQPISIDEAFLDLSGTDRVNRAAPAVALARFAAEVERDIGVSVSIGLATNKFLAKIASDMNKPRGFSVIGPGDAEALLADEPVTILPGIGQRTAERMKEAGLTLVRHLAEREPAELFRLLGRDGDRLKRLARGEDARPIQTDRDTKSISAETTFSTDLSDRADLEPILWRLCEKVSGRLKDAGLAATTVTLKTKTARFRLATKRRSGLKPTQLARRLFEPARTLLGECLDGTPLRLIGIGASDLCDGSLADLGDLVDRSAREEARVEEAIDRIRARFGASALQAGIAFPFGDGSVARPDQRSQEGSVKSSTRASSPFRTKSP